MTTQNKNKGGSGKRPLKSKDLENKLKQQYISSQQQKCSTHKKKKCVSPCEFKKKACVYKLPVVITKDKTKEAKKFLRKTSHVTSMDLTKECKDANCKNKILEECVDLLDTIDASQNTSKQVLDMFAKRPFNEVFNLCTRAAKSVAGDKI